MRIVSPLLKRVLYPSLSSLGAFRRTSATGLAVVTYHGVRPRGYESIDPALDGNLISTETLGRQLQLLRSGYTVITPEDMLAWREGRLSLPAKAVLVTCDDGLWNCLADMLPVLQQEGVKCLFFVTGASAGNERKMLWYEDLFLLLRDAPAGRFQISCEGLAVDEDLHLRGQRRAVWWSLVKRLSQMGATARESFVETLRAQLGGDSRSHLNSMNSPFCRRFGLMTCEELRGLASAGMTIGAHTLSHPVLSQLPTELAYSEIEKSRQSIEAALGTRVWAFAYPFGDPQSVTPHILEMPKAAGYQAAFLNYGGGLGVELPPYALPRIHITTEMSLAELEAHVSGFYARLQRVSGRDG